TPHSSPQFSHDSEYELFAQLIRPRMHTEEYHQLETDMQDAGLDPGAKWPKGMLEWAWSHARDGKHKEIRGLGRACIKDWGMYAFSDLGL
ncbi:hypothetical protein EK21DRAFT_81891, partial [Setomelanomma holmii]